MTTREPLRDVVARCLHQFGRSDGEISRQQHETVLLLTAEHVDRLYVAVEKLTAAAQMMIDTLQQLQGTTDNGTQTGQSRDKAG